MNRCSAKAFTGLLIGLACITGSGIPALAQSSTQAPPPGVRQFPPNALRGELLVSSAPPAVTLDGRDARLSPGARIRGLNNTLVQPASLAGQRLTVNYVRDPAGLIHEVWILNAAEAAQKRASASTGRNFEFASEQDKPPRDDGKTPFHQLPRYKQ